jgi:ABC-type Fe3+ transport system permease subunit
MFPRNRVRFSRRPTILSSKLLDFRSTQPAILAGAAIARIEIQKELSAAIIRHTGATRTMPIAAPQQSPGGDVGIAAAHVRFARGGVFR